MSCAAFALALCLGGCSTDSDSPDAATPTDAVTSTVVASAEPRGNALVDVAMPSDFALPTKLHAYFGGYDGNVTHYDFERTTDALSDPPAITLGAQASFLAIDDTDRSSGSNGPAHGSLDRSGGWAVVANFSNGNGAGLA